MLFWLALHFLGCGRWISLKSLQKQTKQFGLPFFFHLKSCLCRWSWVVAMQVIGIPPLFLFFFFCFNSRFSRVTSDPSWLRLLHDLVTVTSWSFRLHDVTKKKGRQCIRQSSHPQSKWNDHIVWPKSINHYCPPTNGHIDLNNSAHLLIPVDV